MIDGYMRRTDKQAMNERRTHPATERHFSPAEVAELWGIHPQSVRRIFRDRPGVMVLGSRKRIIVRIPESVLMAVHEERTRGFLAEFKSSSSRRAPAKPRTA